MLATDHSRLAAHALRSALRDDVKNSDLPTWFERQLDPLNPAHDGRREAWSNALQTLPLISALDEMIRLNAPTGALGAAVDALAVEVARNLYRAATGDLPLEVTLRRDSVGAELIIAEREDWLQGAKYEYAAEWFSRFTREVAPFSVFPYEMGVDLQP